MEDLTKTQTILLALLVSFVSSVAVSIMTFSLLNEEPLTVTQTVNRVVEKTIETIVPSPAKPDVITKEVTVIVKEEDLIIDAIAQNKESLIKIFKKEDEAETFAGFGLMIDKEGLIASPKIELGEDVLLNGWLDDGSIVSLQFLVHGSNFSFFKIADLTDLKIKESLLGDSGSLQLGQTVVSIKGEEKTQISVGRIISLILLESQSAEAVEDSDGETEYVSIETDMANGSTGSPAINLKGELIGIKRSLENSFIPINVLKSEIKNLASE